MKSFYHLSFFARNVEVTRGGPPRALSLSYSHSTRRELPRRCHLRRPRHRPSRRHLHHPRHRRRRRRHCQLLPTERRRFQYRYVSFFTLLCSSLCRSRLWMFFCWENLRSTTRYDGDWDRTVTEMRLSSFYSDPKNRRHADQRSVACSRRRDAGNRRQTKPSRK
jgi:hypothetical protein